MNRAVEQYKDEPFETRISQGLRAYIRFGLEHPDYYRLLFMQETQKPVHPADTEHYKGYLILMDLVGLAVCAGFFKPVDARIATPSIWSSIHGLVSLVITKRNFEWGDPEAFIPFHVEHIFQSFRA